ncbi:glutathione hydrolase 7 isoform X2 [Halyomorpha halys]
MKGGNSVDVAVAVTVCLGVVLPHLTGIGGNGVLLVYNHKAEKILMCLDSWPPAGTIIVPQLMLALYTAHSSFGHKSWSIILEPAIRIAREGFPVSESLMQSLKHLSPNANDDLKSWLHSLKLGTTIKSPQLAATLAVIQEKGIEALYTGSLHEELTKHFDSKSLSEPSLNKEPCSEAIAKGYHLITSGVGTAGPSLLDSLVNSNFSHNFSVQELADFLLGKEELSWPLPSGVAVNVADKDDNYVSIVSGLGPVLGSQNLLKDGYIVGSLLHRSNLSKINSFGAPFIATTLVHKCEKRIITGGVDVRDMLQVVPKLLWGSESIMNSIEAARVRITENSLLAEINHSPFLPFTLPPASMPYPVINVIKKRGDNVFAYDDSRSL